MKNKRGISAVIETVLLILIVIAAVGIIAGLVLPMIRTAGERTSTCLGAMDITAASSAGVTYVQSKNITVTAVAVTFYYANGTAVSGTTQVPTSVGSSVTSTPTTAGIYAKATVVPTVTTPSGKQVACPAIEAAI
jgi:FlaG/FlaF family flagellin (archaellin)